MPPSRSLSGSRRSLAGLFLFLVLISCSHSEEAMSPADFAAACAKAGAAERKDNQTGIAGNSGDWLFIFSELKHLGLGEFWKEDLTKVTVAGLDPTPLITKYNESLKEAGVRLLLVPVPPKASIYPEHFHKTAHASSVTSRAPYFKMLADKGVDVLDLTPVFLAEKEKNPEALLYCRQDSHPSAHACQLIAQKVAAQVADEAWIADAKKAEAREFGTGAPETITFMGDLASGHSVKAESMEIVPAGEMAGDKISQVKPDAIDSPVVVVGDSHALVFSIGGDFLSKSAGFTDHLQAALGFPVYQQANAGSGVVTARMNLLRAAATNKDFWDGKKLLVWIIGERELTQAFQWKDIPATIPQG